LPLKTQFVFHSVNCFNLSLRKKCFPSFWKLANVIAVFKKSDKSIASNNRPISLLSCVSKIFERTVFKYVFNHILRHEYIHKLHSGFLHEYSTSNQLVEIYHCIVTAFENQTPLSLTFCDVSKAFDLVWIRGLLYKLEKYGMRGDILEWFKTYRTDRTQKVVLNNTESEIGCVYAGVPQGSVLVSILFLIYINDIVDYTDGICRLFADDTSLGHSSNDLQNLQNMINSDLSNINKWSENWLITFNPDKTDIMLFDSRRQ
jgi:sarcosine oxidase/L-pipecolate oxidase